jgi:hypothetical protein
MLYYKTIDPPTLELLTQMLKIPEFKDLRLAGGTALALQIGHRKSIDLDFFGQLKIDEYMFSHVLKQFNEVKLLNQTENIKIYLINGIKTDFVNYSYDWIDQPVTDGCLRLAGLMDIAAMKLAAITGRGTKKDFIDIYFLLRNFTLEEMLAFYDRKYPDGSAFLALKSLGYFEDAEAEQNPVMLEGVEWDEVKNRINKDLKAYFS